MDEAQQKAVDNFASLPTLEENAVSTPSVREAAVLKDATVENSMDVSSDKWVLPRVLEKGTSPPKVADSFVEVASEKDLGHWGNLRNLVGSLFRR